MMMRKNTLSCTRYLVIGTFACYILSVVLLMRRIRPDFANCYLHHPQIPNGSQQLHYVLETELFDKVTVNSTDLTNNTPNIHIPEKDIWQTVVPEKLFVYSAYLDTRQKDHNSIRIIAISHPKYAIPVYCQIWFHPSDHPVLVKGKLSALPEQSRNAHQAALIECKLERFPRDDQPLAASIVTESRDSADNLLEVHNNRIHSKPHYNFTVCLGGPLKFGLNNTNQLTEWLELNAMFGADHFILYNHSASAEMRPYVDYYENRRKLIEWLPWKLPDTIENPRRMKNFGHIGLVNDCLYRSMYHSAMTVFVDTDEFIVPRRANVKTWQEMLRQTQCLGASFVSVKNVFFKKEWPDDRMVATQNDRIKQLDLVTQLKTKRELKIWPHTSRSKYMARPENVMVTGIHKVWQFKGPIRKFCKLSEDDALVHHYRWWDDPRPRWTVDRFAHHYQEPLINRVEQVHEQVKGHKQP